MLLAIAIASTLVAITMSVVAWRASRAERERSAARVEALSRAIDGERLSASDLTLHAAEAVPFEGRYGPLLSAAQAGGTGSRLGLALAMGAFLVTTAAAAAIVFSSESPTAPRASEASTRPPSVPNFAIELVALDHERDGDTLTVHGIIRNPAGGVELDGLSAVVSLIGVDGTASSSARSTVDSQALLPGGQTAFSVMILQAGNVARYRVSFRSGDRVIPHLDKRIGS